MVCFATTRRLHLEDIPYLGWAGTNSYHLGAEFWLQLGMMLKRPLPSVVSGQQAAVMADYLENQSGMNWDLHMYFWRDPNKRMLREFIAFLRGGAFEVTR